MAIWFRLWEKCHHAGDPPVWPDNETDLDFLNFAGIGDTIAEMIAQANGRPISIGVSGAWGAGKSSLIKLTRRSLAALPAGSREYVFVEFNAWLYQGYDDARAALMEEIATTLEREANKRKKGTEKVASLLRRVNWLRAAKLAAGSALALSLGLPPVGLIGELWRAGKTVTGGGATEKDLEGMDTLGARALDTGKDLLASRPESSAPKQIRELRESFQDALKEMGVTLVVLIDDLDRCLPETTISTLEAIRLFLFLENAAFVIAADDEMIRHAVKRHFDNISDAAVTNYFDKLIQIPIRVPPLGVQEVRAYLMLLFVETSSLSTEKKVQARASVVAQLARSWEGKRVDRRLVESVGPLPEQLNSQLDVAERLAPLMASASGVGGNPRLIKRFLNALSIRMSISKAHKVGVDYAVLAKMLLLERMDSKLYALVLDAVSSSSNGRPAILGDLEKAAADGEDASEPWSTRFARAWLALPPLLAEQDLRGAIYVSREHAPLVLPEDRLSVDGAALLRAMINTPGVAGTLRERLGRLPATDIPIMMTRLLEQAAQEQEWGAPPILEACILLARVDDAQGGRLATFLMERPAPQIKASIVPRIGAEAWSGPVLERWASSEEVSRPVKSAIQTRRGSGNKSVK